MPPDFVECSPTPRVRCLISIALVAHFFAIGTAVLCYSTAGFPAPQLAVAASQPMQPYLQATFLNNAYRFFAPNPGTPTVLWFRVQFEDRSVRWVEAPGEPNSMIRGAYQRRLNHSIMLGQHLVADPAQDGKRAFTPVGQICLESCVRHVARTHGQSSVKSIGVYVVHHTVITPEQIRSGWTPTDLRTYHPTFVGAYSAEGERIDEMRPGVKVQPIGQLVAGILQSDVYPLLAREKGEPARQVGEHNLPQPIARFLTVRPELLEPGPAAELQDRVERLCELGARQK